MGKNGVIGQILTTVVALVVTYFFGPYAGAAVMLAGTIITGHLATYDPIEGSRREGGNGVIAEYGATIPHVFGFYKVDGRVIFCEELKEQAETRRVGKSLFSKGQKITEYKYYANMALLLTEGQVNGIRKIWANGKLIYDVSNQNFKNRFKVKNTEEILNSFSSKNEQYLSDYHFILYNKKENEESEILKSKLKIDEIERYKNYSYVIVNNLPVAEFGNAIPSFSFEVVADDEMNDSEVKLEELFPNFKKEFIEQHSHLKNIQNLQIVDLVKVKNKYLLYIKYTNNKNDKENEYYKSGVEYYKKYGSSAYFINDLVGKKEVDVTNNNNFTSFTNSEEQYLNNLHENESAIVVAEQRQKVEMSRKLFTFKPKTLKTYNVYKIMSIFTSHKNNYFDGSTVCNFVKDEEENVNLLIETSMLSGYYHNCFINNSLKNLTFGMCIYNKQFRKYNFNESLSSYECYNTSNYKLLLSKGTDYINISYVSVSNKKFYSHKIEDGERKLISFIDYEEDVYKLIYLNKVKKVLQISRGRDGIVDETLHVYKTIKIDDEQIKILESLSDKKVLKSFIHNNILYILCDYETFKTQKPFFYCVNLSNEVKFTKVELNVKFLEFFRANYNFNILKNNEYIKFYKKVANALQICFFNMLTKKVEIFERKFDKDFDGLAFNQANEEIFYNDKSVLVKKFENFEEIEEYKLSVLLQKILIWSGLRSDQFDLTKIKEDDKKIRGYIINNPSAVKDSLKDLAAIYNFMCVEKNGVLIFDYVKNYIIYNFDENEIGVDFYDDLENINFDEKLKIEKVQSFEAPHRILFNFVDENLDYANNVVENVVSSVNSNIQKTVTTTLNLNDTESKKIINNLSSNSMSGDRKLNIEVDLKYDFLNLNDLVSVTTSDGVTQTFIISKKVVDKIIIKFELMSYNPTVEIPLIEMWQEEIDINTPNGGNELELLNTSVVKVPFLLDKNLKSNNIVLIDEDLDLNNDNVAVKLNTQNFITENRTQLFQVDTILTNLQSFTEEEKQNLIDFESKIVISQNLNKDVNIFEIFNEYEIEDMVENPLLNAVFFNNEVFRFTKVEQKDGNVILSNLIRYVASFNTFNINFNKFKNSQFLFLLSNVEEGLINIQHEFTKEEKNVELLIGGDIYEINDESFYETFEEIKMYQITNNIVNVCKFEEKIELKFNFNEILTSLVDTYVIVKTSKIRDVEENEILNESFVKLKEVEKLVLEPDLKTIYITLSDENKKIKSNTIKYLI